MEPLASTFASNFLATTETASDCTKEKKDLFSLFTGRTLGQNVNVSPWDIEKAQIFFSTTLIVTFKLINYPKK